MVKATVLVSQLVGQAWVRDADGNLTPLREGMRIPVNAEVVTASGSSVQLQADGQPPLTLGENQDVALSHEVFEDIPAAEAAVPAASDPLVNNLIAALKEGQDPLADLEPTAATLGGGGGGGSTFVRLASVLEPTTPLALAYPRGALEVPEDRRGGTASDSNAANATPVLPVVTLYNGKLTLSAAATMLEGNKIVVTATVDQPPVGTDLVITLTTGETIVIPVGQTSGTVEVPTRTDDAYIQGTDTHIFEVGSTTGGGYDALDTRTSTQTDVVDDQDATQITLSSNAQVTEGDKITVTATVDKAPVGTDLVITLKTGESITIPVGQTTGYAEVPSRTDDAFVQGTETQTFAIGSTTGGGYEALDTRSTTETSVVDDQDATKITLSSNAQVTEGDKITVTATVDKAPVGTDLVIKLVTGESITIPVGKTTGQVEVTTRADDAFVQGTETKTFEIETATGGGYEALDTRSTTETNVVDDQDATKITLSSNAQVTEGDKITVTATVDKAPVGTDLVIKLVTGESITIAVGKTSGQVEVTTRADDAFVQGTAIQKFAISSATGGDYEALDTRSTTETNVVDDQDATKITLSSNAQVTEGDKITVTATVDKAPVGTDLVIKLVTGESITIAVGKTSGQVEVTTRADDAFVQGTAIQKFAIGSTTGGSYEALDTRSTTETRVVDDQDATKITLHDVTVFEGSGSATLGASLNYQPQTTLVVTLSNGATVTFGAQYQPGDVVQSTPFTVQGDDVYQDGSSDVVRIAHTKGGGAFEFLDTSDTATVKVQDTINTTTVKVTAVDGKEGDANVTFHFQLSNPPDPDFAGKTELTVNVGGTIYTAAVKADGSATLSVPNSNGADVYKDASQLQATVTAVTGGNFEAISLAGATATAAIADTIDLTTVSVSAIVTKTSTINVGNVTTSGSFTVTATKSDGSVGQISQVTGTNHDGFGVTGATSGSADSSELGYGTNGDSEKISVVFNNAVKTFDVQFAWRHNGEKAKVEFFDANGKSVGWAIVSGGGTNTDALVTYYDATGKVTKTAKAPGGTDKVDLSYTFEPGSGQLFTEAVFTAVGKDDDYLIHSIRYKEVVAGSPDPVAGNTDVVFEVQTSNPPDASKYDFLNTFPTATVEIAGTAYVVNLDINGRGTVAVHVDGTVSLTAKVVAVDGNFEAVQVPTSLTVFGPAEPTPTAPPDSGNTVPPTPSVVNAPKVTLDVEAHNVAGTAKDPLAGTTAVNGGATASDGNGFNLDANGNIVAIGWNVRVWGTETSKGPNGSTAIHDFANNIQVYQADGSHAAAQFGVNLIRYGYSSDLSGNSANANAPSDNADNTDLFLLHSQSGYWSGNGNTPDGEYGAWQSFNNFTGNGGQLTSTEPDYVVLIGDAAQGAVLVGTPTSNNASTNANVLESVSINTSTGAKVVSGGNKVEAIIAGGALLYSTPGHSDVSTFTPVSSNSQILTYTTVYDVAITAMLADLDGSGEGLLSQLVLSGIPAGATVTYGSAVLSADAEGKVTLTGLVANDGSVHAELTISSAGDADFTLTAYAQSYDAEDASSKATGQDMVAVQSGNALVDSLVGTDGSDLLLGAAGNDHLSGGKGDDRLEGGAGSDTLLGGDGDDVFVWGLGDQGSTAVPAVDVVKDFGNGNDVLDLRDLLQGENSGNLSSYLGISSETVDGKVNTVLSISSTGHLADQGADQKIVLEGVSMDTSDQAKLVQDLISQGKLHVDL